MASREEALTGQAQQSESMIGKFVAADDAIVSPTYVPDLANASLDLLIDGERGIWHLANEGALTWAEFARRAADLAGLDARAVVAQPLRAFSFAAARPPYSALGSERGVLLPGLDEAMSRYMEERGNDFSDYEAEKQSGTR